MESVLQNQRTQFRIVKFVDLLPPEIAMRGDAMDGEFNELVSSIDTQGLLNPLTVKARDDKFEVIAGHRRYLAIAQLGWEHVPVMEYRGGEKLAEVAKVHENIIRERVKATDEARYYRKLLERHGIEPRELAKLLGKPKAFVEERLQILEYPDMLYEAVDKELVTLGIAKELYRMKDLRNFPETLGYIISSGGTVVQVKGWVDGWLQEAQFRAQSDDGANPIVSGVAYVEPEVVCELSGKKYKLSETKLLRVGWDVYEDLKAAVSDAA